MLDIAGETRQNPTFTGGEKDRGSWQTEPAHFPRTHWRLSGSDDAATLIIVISEPASGFQQVLSVISVEEQEEEVHLLSNSRCSRLAELMMINCFLGLSAECRREKASSSFFFFQIHDGDAGCTCNSFSGQTDGRTDWHHV